MDEPEGNATTTQLHAVLEVTAQDWKVETRETRLQFTGRCYRWKTSKLWNELPATLREETSVCRFKKKTENFDTGEEEQTSRHLTPYTWMTEQLCT